MKTLGIQRDPLQLYLHVMISYWRAEATGVGHVEISSGRVPLRVVVEARKLRLLANGPLPFHLALQKHFERLT